MSTDRKRIAAVESKGSGGTDFDLERDLPTTPEDVEALRRLRHRPLTPGELLAFLQALPQPSQEVLAKRRGPHGEPFEL